MRVALDRHEFVAAMAVRGLAQQDLATLAGVSESAVSQAARGRAISPRTFGRIAAALAAAPVISDGAVHLLGRQPVGDPG